MLPSDFSFGGDAGALDDQARAREEREAAEFKVPCGLDCEAASLREAEARAGQMVPLASMPPCSSTAGPQACSPEQAQGAQALQIHRPARGGGGRQGMGRQGWAPAVAVVAVVAALQTCRPLAVGVRSSAARCYFLWRAREAARAR